MTFRSCTSQQTQISIGLNQKTQYRSLWVDVLYIKIIFLWLLHALLRHMICVGRQTPWPSHIRPWPRIGKSSHNQTWAHITSYDYLRPVNVTLFNIRTNFIPTPFPDKLRTYVRSLLHAYYAFHTKFAELRIHPLSLTHAQPCMWIFLLCDTFQSKYSHTFTFIYVRVKATIRFYTHSRFVV